MEAEEKTKIVELLLIINQRAKEESKKNSEKWVAYNAGIVYATQIAITALEELK